MTKAPRHPAGIDPVFADLPTVDSIEVMPADGIPAALARIAVAQSQLSALQSRLVLRLATDAARDVADGEDRLVTVEAAAALLQKSEVWLYRHARALPFTRRVGRSLRFSTRGIRRFIERSGLDRP
jgi:predicted DNA-binding transcriptional regulator AlpA